MGKEMGGQGEEGYATNIFKICVKTYYHRNFLKYTKAYERDLKRVSEMRETVPH